jgi:signal transduction histidine kinase
MTAMTAMTTTEPRRNRSGFRVRVLGFAAALLAAATVASLLVQRTVLLRRLDNQVAASLEQERQELERLAAGRNPETGAPFDGDVAAIFDTFLSRNVPAAGEVYLTYVAGELHLTTPPPAGVRLDEVPERPARWAALTTTDRGRLDSAAGPVEYLAVPLRSGGQTAGVFVVGNFLQDERDQILDRLRTEALVDLGVLVVAVGAAWVIAGRLLRPVRHLTDTARSITETDLSRRIPVDGDDEIAELTVTFNAMLDRLEGAFTAQRAFVDDAGHELRTPITIVRGHLELMGDSPEEHRETVALVTDELDRMARIVDDLLVLAKAEQPDFLRVGPILVAELTADLLTKARALGDRDWRLDTSAYGEVVGDEQRLTQAVLNLARNAVEHTAPGAEIGIGSERRGDDVAIWVRDNGTGIDERDRGRIFDRFARGRGDGRRSDGAGLGLAIVDAITRAHGGRIDLDSTPGIGATFTIVLPARHAPADPPELDLSSADPTAPLDLSGDATHEMDLTEEPT